MSVVVNNVTKVYGSQKAVDEISFILKKGEITGFLGPNGAGKSTTLKMLVGALGPDLGTISIDGLNILEEPIKAKRKIGYLAEHNPLYAEMYVREFLRMAAAFHGVANPKDAVEDAIAKTGLTGEANKTINQLSKGYRQRVGLAQALIHNPEVLILDEPLSGLDPNQLAEIREVIKELGQNRILIFSSHILQQVQQICDRLIIIHKGKIAADGKLADILARNRANDLETVFKDLTPA